MELEAIGKKMLEIMAISGQITGMENDLTVLEQDIATIEVNIKANMSFRKGLEKQEADLQDRLNMKFVAEAKIKDQIKELQNQLAAIESEIDNINKAFEAVSADVFKDLDMNTTEKRAFKAAKEKAVDLKLVEIEAAKLDLAARKKALKEETGVEVSIGNPRVPKTTFM